ncbi:DUF3461 family protein [uncultured Thiothrix sp.]|uniref:DUF3461 family protein n=1 Tax=uncultured Thiothrix sp. TaxID=223185 RepID=UPI002622706C|nr:DUF3461 family protein [uncultured Thiothrix sp.]
MTTQYPNLAQMGVQNPQEIIGYTLSHIAPATDVLKIKYQRPKGSLLPITRSYNIGRAVQTRMIDSGTATTGEIYEISPVLSKAIYELDIIVDAKTSKEELKKHILAELDRVELEFVAEMRALRHLMAKLDSAK